MECWALMTVPRTGRGVGGKYYPSRALTVAERLHIARRVHQLRCASGLTVEGVRAALAAEGITRSAGSVHAALHGWRCAHCSSPDGAAPPRHHETPAQGLYRAAPERLAATSQSWCRADHGTSRRCRSGPWYAPNC